MMMVVGVVVAPRMMINERHAWEITAIFMKVVGKF
jgi:hypothetical protein